MARRKHARLSIALGALLAACGCAPDFGLVPGGYAPHEADTATDSLVVDRWSQGPAAGEPVDVVVLIDGSCSMDVTESGQARDAVVSLAAAMPEADWRIWMGSTDAHPNLSGPLTPESSLEAIELTAAQHTSSREEGLAGVFTSVEHTGLLRRDAHLVAVVVSDEDDGGQEDAGTWRNWWAFTRSDPWETGLVAVTALESHCGDYPARYEAAGFDLLDLCSEDWPEALPSRVSWLRERRSWTLTQVPDPSTLWVDVDGVEAGYVLDGQRITLDEPPALGARIVATYYALGE